MVLGLLEEICYYQLLLNKESSKATRGSLQEGSLLVTI
jgi:hypothetical protein